MRHYFGDSLAISIVAAFVVAAPATGQQPSILLQDGQKAYTTNCIDCHGPDAEGTAQGPPLAGNRRLRTRSIQQVRSVIEQGSISAGMPAFHLPAPELDALAAFVHSLNSPAAQSFVPGAPLAGEQFFFGKGQCSGCHMVRGKGQAIGPDLSNIASELTVSEIRQVLLRPETRITPGYNLVAVRLRDGSSLRGFARGRTNFDLQLQGLNGRFYMLDQAQIDSIQELKESLMKPLNASSDEARDLVAYLSRLAGVQPGVAAQQSIELLGPAGIAFSRIQNPPPGDWLTYNGNLSGNRYS